MIEMSKGNILEADAEALVNTVNCVGIMGKGIALQFKQRFPDNFVAYDRSCKAGEVQPGRMMVFETGMMVNPKYIVNFPTKRHWKGKSKIKDIENGLSALIEEVKRLKIKSIAVPPLGCGNGGLDWSDVRPLIERAFESLPDTRALLYAPLGAPDADTMPVKTARPGMTRARAAITKLIEQYGVPGYRLSMLELQKLAYFVQVAGEDLKLTFVKNKFGPYSETLHFPLQRIEGHFIRGYGDRSRDAKVFVLPGASEEADQFLQEHYETNERLQRVGQLIEGLENPYGMELLATVHWVATQNDPLALDEDAAIQSVHSWSDRKRKLFRPEHIRFVWSRLNEQGWI